MVNQVFFNNEARKNPITMLWSIKKKKWFNGPKLPLGDGEIIKFNHMCATSVGSNTVFIINPDVTYSFNIKTIFGKFHKPPPGITYYSNLPQKIDSCACHSQKNYLR